MRLPIAYALEFPDRLPTNLARLDLSKPLNLTFEPPDQTRFPALAQAFKSLQISDLAPLALNAANEIAVASFLAGRIKFTDIPIITANALDNPPRGSVTDLADLLEADRLARLEAEALINRGTLTPSRR
jgi:1-deoxy-D-xylulose-5-phosphate reductoisomerase